MAKDLSAIFEKEMRYGALAYQRKTGTPPTRYLQLIDQLGGVSAATSLAVDQHIQSGLQKAAEHDCIELTSEYLIIHGQNGEFSSLFAQEVITAAKRKLDALREFRDILKRAGSS